MNISVVVPAYNEERLLPESLAAINRSRDSFTDAGLTSELVVCDNNSTDRTAQIARAAGARVVFEPVNQISRARNTGAAVATGEWLLFIDADSRPSPELLAAVARAIRSGHYIAGGSTVRLAGNHPAANLMTLGWNWISRLGRMLAGSFIFVETAAFRKIGGFSEALFTGEELDLSQRLKPIARGTNRKLIIIHRHPLLTSDRKVRLYSGRELLGFMIRAAFSPRRIMRDKNACHAWYDGRR